MHFGSRVSIASRVVLICYLVLQLVLQMVLPLVLLLTTHIGMGESLQLGSPIGSPDVVKHGDYPLHVACYSAYGRGLDALVTNMFVRLPHAKHINGERKPDQLQIVARNAPLFMAARLSAPASAPSIQRAQLLVRLPQSMHNAGTNVPTKMLHQYYAVDCTPRPTGDGQVVVGDANYWKHMYTDSFEKPLVIFLCVRHPAAWIASGQRRSYELFPESKPGVYNRMRRS